MPGESKLSVAQAGLPPGLTVGALLAAAALAVVAQLVCHRCGGMGAHAAQPLAARAEQFGPRGVSGHYTSCVFGAFALFIRTPTHYKER